jgi:hypothetical protein
VNRPNELQKQTSNILPSDVSISSPSKQKKEDNLPDIPTTLIKTTTTTNGAVTSHIPVMTSSSSSSSSLSVSTPSSAEHVTRKQLPSSTQVLRRGSMSTPGAPITLILNKVIIYFCFFFRFIFLIKFLGSKRFIWFNISTT